MWSQVTQFVERHYRLLLVLILAFAFATRLWQLHYPNGYYFDEVYHAVTAKLIAHNDPRAFEWWHPAPEPNTAIDWLHPPLAKYTQAASMLVFGENGFGWRFSSAVFGVLVIYLTAVLAEKLFKNKTVMVLAAFLASMDGLLLVMSRIAMNDIHVTFAILLSFVLYLSALESNKKASSEQGWIDWLKVSLALGLALGSKWSGFFAVVAIAGSEICRGLWAVMNHKWQRDAHKPSSLDANTIVMSSARWFFTLICIPAFLYVASYSLMLFQGKDWSHFRELHRQIWAYQTTLEATHSYQSRPIQWWLDDKPVWMYVKYKEDNVVENIFAFGNPVIFWVGAAMTFVTIAWLLSGLAGVSQQLALEKSNKKMKAIIATALEKFLPLTWLWLCYLAVWLPWQFSPRIMFFYHYTPAVPLMCILIAAWLNKLWHFVGVSTTVRMLIVGGVVAAAFAVFLVWYPHWTAMPISSTFANAVYFWRASWK